MNDYPLIQIANNLPPVSQKEYEYITRIEQLEKENAKLSEENKKINEELRIIKQNPVKFAFQCFGDEPDDPEEGAK